MTWDAVRLLIYIWALPAAVVVAAVIAVRLVSRRRKRSESPATWPRGLLKRHRRAADAQG